MPSYGTLGQLSYFVHPKNSIVRGTYLMILYEFLLQTHPMNQCFVAQLKVTLHSV